MIFKPFKDSSHESLLLLERSLRIILAIFICAVAALMVMGLLLFLYVGFSLFIVLPFLFCGIILFLLREIKLIKMEIKLRESTHRIRR